MLEIISNADLPSTKENIDPSTMQPIAMVSQVSSKNGLRKASRFPLYERVAFQSILPQYRVDHGQMFEVAIILDEAVDSKYVHS